MISVSGIVLLAKILGFVKQMITANAFGATIETDLIALSEGLISNIDFLLIQALSTAFVPIYIKLKKENEANSRLFVSNTIKFFLVFTIGVSILLFAASPLLSRILAPSYSSELSGRLSTYIRVLSPALVLIIEMAVFSSLLKANERFAPGELIGLIQSIILILLVVAFGGFVGPDILIIGLYVYAAINIVFLMICSRPEWRITRGNPFTDKHVKELLAMITPLLLGYSIIFVNQQVDKIIVSGLGEGTITAMNYAAVLSNFVVAFIGSVSGVMFTYITQRIVAHDDQGAAQLTASGITHMMVVLLPISVLTVMNSKDIVSIVFGRGRFDENAIHACSVALIGYGFIFVPYIVRELLSRIQYGYGETKRPMINSSIAIAFNIVGSILLSHWFGVFGVTLATSISVAVCAVLNFFSAKRYNENIRIVTDLKTVFSMVIGSLICIAISIVAKAFFGQWNHMLRFLVVTMISLSLYFLINKKSVKALVLSLRGRTEERRTMNSSNAS